MRWPDQARLALNAEARPWWPGRPPLAAPPEFRSAG